MKEDLVQAPPNWWKRGVLAFIAFQFFVMVPYNALQLSGAEPLDDPRRCAWVGAPPLAVRFCSYIDEKQVKRNLWDRFFNPEALG